MKLQNTDTTNRLKTLTQMKNTVASSLTLNSSRFSAKKAYTTGRSLARGRRAHSQPKTGTRASIATNVPVNSHCSFSVPASTARAARMRYSRPTGRNHHEHRGLDRSGRAGCAGAVRDRGLQPAGRPAQPFQECVLADRRAAEAPLRPDPELGRVGQRLPAA